MCACVERDEMNENGACFVTLPKVMGSHMSLYHVIATLSRDKYGTLLQPVHKNEQNECI